MAPRWYWDKTVAEGAGWATSSARGRGHAHQRSSARPSGALPSSQRRRMAPPPPPRTATPPMIAPGRPAPISPMAAISRPVLPSPCSAPATFAARRRRPTRPGRRCAAADRRRTARLGAAQPDAGLAVAGRGSKVIVQPHQRQRHADDAAVVMRRDLDVAAVDGRGRYAAGHEQQHRRQQGRAQRACAPPAAAAAPAPAAPPAPAVPIARPPAERMPQGACRGARHCSRRASGRPAGCRRHRPRHHQQQQHDTRAERDSATAASPAPARPPASSSVQVNCSA